MVMKEELPFLLELVLLYFYKPMLLLFFARYLSNHQDVIEVLQRVALVIFVLITIYFLFIAKSEEKQQIEPKIKSKKSRFFQGIFMSALNVFPIPYQAYMTITIASFGWLEFDTTSIFTYVTGTAMGSFIMFYVYIFFFEKIKDKPLTSQKNMNYLIGSITGVVSLITAFSVFKEM